MKILNLKIVTEKELIEKCIDRDPMAQHSLYEQYKDILYPICLRYLADKSYSEDALMNAFVKIFQNLRHFQFNGSFEGWMKRITVNECLMLLRKLQRLKENYYDEEIVMPIHSKGNEALLENDILQLIELLPDGYRTIFNLYVLEGYKHKEIAQLLEISIHTSKSQLRMARLKLIDMLKEMNYPNISSYIK